MFLILKKLNPVLISTNSMY